MKPKDFKNLNTPNYPTVLFWNRDGDFYPSIPVKSDEYHIYKLHNILAPNLLKNVHIIDELLGTDTSSDDLKAELTVLKGNMLTSLKKVAPSVDKWEKTQPPNWGPGLPQESQSQVPLASGLSPSDPQPSHGPQSQTVKRRKRTISKIFTCQICGNVAYAKKSELEDHMLREHNVWPPIVCPHCQSKTRDEHVKTVCA